MKVIIILNGISLHKKKFYHDIFPLLKDRFAIEVFETATRNDAVTLASKASQHAAVVLAAGGDGTVFQVANGLLQTEGNLPVMGVIPLGSGNDFARGLEIPNDKQKIVSMLENMNTMDIDVGKVFYTTADGQTDSRYFLNVVDVGMGPVVVDRVLKSGRPFGSAVAYYSSIFSTFLSFKPIQMKAKAAGWTWEGKMRSFAIANGKYYGHGLCIAPMAKLDDGMLEVFVCGDASAWDFILQSIPLKKGKRINHPKVSYHYTDQVALSSTEDCMIEADGELLGNLPARVALASHKMKFLVP